MKNSCSQGCEDWKNHNEAFYFNSVALLRNSQHDTQHFICTSFFYWRRKRSFFFLLQRITEGIETADQVVLFTQGYPREPIFYWVWKLFDLFGIFKILAKYFLYCLRTSAYQMITGLNISEGLCSFSHKWEKYEMRKI
jgi:hypothetical protein